MPTTTWIQETVEDRYWESQAGEAESPCGPPVYACVVCGKEFDSSDARSWHASQAHPLARPTLYIADYAAPAELVVRTPVEARLFSAESCTSVRVALDGERFRAIDSIELGRLISGRQSGHLRIELENRRAADSADVQARYTIRIAIPDNNELAEVDRAFVRNLAIDRPSTREVETFASEVESLRSASEYAGALGDYVHGVLVKESSQYGGATLPFAAFEGKFSRALAGLSDHATRPVAAAAVALARLNLNDLAAPVQRSGDGSVDRCLKTLSEVVTAKSGSEPEEPGTGVAEIALCPIDRDTHLVCASHEAILDPDVSETKIAELNDRADDARLSPQDRAKLHTLLAIGALRHGRSNLASAHLEALTHDGVFGRWAERVLEGEVSVG